ncbi:MAG: hypothetical protein AAF633_19340 [Chloroflexota bacterium]
MTEVIDKKAERQARKEQRQLINAARGMRSKMIRFCQDERFAQAFGKALPLYWNNFYDLTCADEMDMNESLRFFDWFFFDYQDEALDKRLVEYFAEEKREDVSEKELTVIDGWVDSPATSAYEFVDFDAINARFKLKDFFTEEEVIAFSPAGFGQSKRGDLILVRILPVGSDKIFSTVGVFLPQDEIKDLREKMDAALEADKEAHPEGTHNGFLRRNNHLITHHVLDQAIDAGRFAVSRFDPTRMDKAVKRAGKKIVGKFKRKKKK